jgi:hypothetical protein
VDTGLQRFGHFIVLAGIELDSPLRFAARLLGLPTEARGPASSEN